MKKIIPAFFLVVLSVICLSGCSKSDQSVTSKDSEQPQSSEIIQIKINDIPLSVEAAKSNESITKGLGERDAIGSDGMLFFMPERNVVNFWMHGMRFPLDFVWIDQNKIVGTISNVQAPVDPSSFELPSYSSEVPVTHVLELPAGKVAEMKLTTDMIVTIE